ncbi:STAS domain-containing protein [Algiphilus sp.]|uniref:STAS domain-containing protein n=1 Tax=Algiphilus sp. TaxID=1872431 RepID=UPI002A5EF552|nr:STAS domain-containing protein [Pseudomonadota bacterium]
MPPSGALTQHTVADVLRRHPTVSDDGVVDLSGVTRADSAAVALLLEWRRRHGAPLTLRNPPDALQRLLTLYGVDTILTN